MAIEVDTRKAIALLAYLAMSEGPQSRDTIASLLWCDLDASGARAALRRTLSTLKSALHEPALESDRRTIMLRRDSLDIDVDRFRSALERVRGHTHALRQACPACLPLLVEAVTLSRGDFLTGFSLRDALEFDDWQLLQTEALRQDLAEALEGIVAALSKTGRHQDAIQYAQRWLKLDPLHEAAHRSLMQLYSRSGQRSSALRQYRECVRILEEELAVPPVEETTRLYQAIKEREDSSSSSEPIMPVAEQSAPRLLPLVGRAREWDALAGAFEAMRRGGHVVALEGEAGVGKTRLLDELLRYSRTAGAATVRARCFEGETELAYAPVIHLLRTAARDRPRILRLQPAGPCPGRSAMGRCSVSRVFGVHPASSGRQSCWGRPDLAQRGAAAGSRRSPRHRRCPEGGERDGPTARAARSRKRPAPCRDAGPGQPDIPTGFGRVAL